MNFIQNNEATEKLVSLQKREAGIKVEHERRDGKSHRTNIRLDVGKTWQSKDGRRRLEAGGFYSHQFGRDGGIKFRRPDYGVGARFSWKF